MSNGATSVIEGLASPEEPLRLALPSQQHRAPGEASAEGGEEDEVAGVQAAQRDRLGERDVDGGGAGVAVAVDVDERAVHRQPQSLGRRLDDAQVRLMRDEQVHVARGEAVAFEQLYGAVAEQPDRDL